MLTLKFMKQGGGYEMESTTHYSVEGGDPGELIVSIGDADDFHIGHNSAYSACYVMNESGKTIDTIRVRS